MNTEKTARPLGHHAHRRVIGFLGLTLPTLVVVISMVVPVRSEWELLGSISAFYYTSANALFVGVLFALALFLFLYGGYEGDVADRRLGRLGAFAALGVAFFPTATPDGFDVPAWWVSWMHPVHNLSAAVLFGVFIAFSLWLFRRSSAATPSQMSRGKRVRNLVYLWCGVVMLACVAWAGIAGLLDRSIFVPEAIALIAFSISWLTKGRTIRWIRGAARGSAPS